MLKNLIKESQENNNNHFNYLPMGPPCPEISIPSWETFDPRAFPHGDGVLSSDDFKSSNGTALRSNCVWHEEVKYVFKDLSKTGTETWKYVILLIAFLLVRNIYFYFILNIYYQLNQNQAAWTGPFRENMRPRATNILEAFQNVK